MSRKGGSGFSSNELEQPIKLLSNEEMQAIEFYSQNGREINDFLRGGNDWMTYGSDFANDVSDSAFVLTQVLNKSSLPTDADTLRGGTTDELSDLFKQTPEARNDPSKLIGSTYKNPGILSTTFEGDYAKEYVENYGLSNGVLFHTTFKKGSKALYIDQVSGEQELIGASNTKFIITNAYRDKNGMLNVYMTTR